MYRYPALAILSLALLVACAGPDPEPPPELRRAISAAPESLDPQIARSVPAVKILGDLFEGLLTHGPDGGLLAGAARAWSSTEDGLLWTFELREGLRWSNGDPLTAEDFVWSFRRLVDPRTDAFYASALSSVAGASDILAGDAAADTLGVEAVGPLALTIRLAHPLGDLLHRLAHPSAAPVHRPSIENWGDDHPAPDRLVSNGPYRLVEHVTGAGIGLEKNTLYRDPLSVPIERVRYFPMEDAMAEYERYVAGELDITSRVPTALFEELARDRPDELRVAPYLGVYYLGFNLRKPPFRDAPELRRALSLAIDRHRVVDSVTGRGEQAAWSWVPPAVGDYEPARLDYADADRDRRHDEARRLYRQAGYGSGVPLRFTLRYNTSDENRRIAAALQSMWREVLGAEVELSDQAFRVLLADTRRGDMPGLFRGSWIADYDDPGNFLAIFTTGHSANQFGYANAAYDSLVAAGLRERGTEERAELFANAEGLMLSEHPVIPVFFYVSKHLVHPRVGGWVDNSLDYHYSRHLRLRRMASDRPGG